MKRLTAACAASLLATTAFAQPDPTDWDAVLEEARGQTVYWNAWGGSTTTNDFIAWVGDRVAEDVGWSYPEPTPAFEPIRNFVAFYAGPMDRCMVDDEQARPQPGGFYGGWITSKVVGPFKGEPGTGFW